MKQKLRLCLVTICLSLLCTSAALAASDQDMVRIGLFYGDGALASANLENSSGSGYRFGTYDGAGQFVHLGSTTQTQISMLKTETMYLNNGLYYAANPGGGEVIGCYHLQLSGSYGSFQEAQMAAGGISGAFPAWINGQFVVRVGAYASQDAAARAQSSLGSASSVVGTSAAGVSIVRTKSAEILFQFDSAGGEVLAVKPGLDDGTKAVTWFKGYRYYGDFLYERLGGGNLTVSNYINMEDYIKGVLPYEMSASWPLEALKAQAVCARNYTVVTSGARHKSQHFDLCNTTCCQVYRGTNQASENSDRAVEETRGVYAYYDGKPAQTFYYSSNGGASEDVRNVWSSSSNIPYLCGVKDPYEETIADSISGYRWSVSFTSQALTTLLQSKGYKCSTIVDLRVTQNTPLGNVFSIVFIDSNGNSFPFSRERVRTILGLKSMRFQINGGSGVSGGYYVDGNSSLPSLSGLWSIGSESKNAQLSDAGLYTITASGTEALVAASGASTGSSTASSGLFTITGSGNGHHIGMSQWGAYAMAKQGMPYDQILKFYFVGIDLH